MLKIDMHSHILPKHMPDWAKKFGYEGFISMHHHKKGTARMMQGKKFFREVQSNCWDGKERIEEYAKHQTQVQVICTVPVLFAYWAKGQDGLEISRFINDNIAETVAKFPKNYIGLGTVPMQDTNLAIQELKRIKHKLKLPGIQIGSNINDINLSDKSLYPIFQTCQELDLSILVHPWNMMAKDKMPEYWLPWLVGMPAETARAIASLIFSGVFEKLPKLRWCFAHAGGSFIPTIGRLKHGFDCRPDLVAKDNAISPEKYLGKFWVDSITHDADLLRLISDKIGYDKIVLGSDYPFPLGDLTIGTYLEYMQLNKDTLEKIYFKNTLQWLNLSENAYL